MFGVFKHSNMLSWCAKKLRGKKIILQDFVSHKKNKKNYTLCLVIRLFPYDFQISTSIKNYTLCAKHYSLVA